ncbi:MAG: hypothetical protein JRI23_31125 [Deltaproteobacteria bacterium]|jgi:aminopeptidase N|nr:hypothetical protein [Deltaproteobacteria bacterium]MBW2536655.1 hypothetical protein [Deltaproteobacteria bacterium]
MPKWFSRRPAAWLGAVGALIATSAYGRPPPDVLPAEPADRVAAHLERERLLASLPLGTSEAGVPAPVSLDGAAYDYDNFDAEVTWDPDTGSVDATVTLTIRGQEPSDPAFYLLVDEGLSFTGATAAGYTVTVDSSTHSPFRYGTVSISPTPPAGEQLVVEVTYAGTLQCNPRGARSSASCGDDGELFYVMDGAALPLLSDGADPYGFDGFSRSLTLHTPLGRDILASGDLQSRSDDGTTQTTVWRADAFSSSIYFVVLAGDFGHVDAPGTSPPVSVVHVASSPEWSDEMASWMQTIVPFLDEQSGASFPFAALSTVKLPELSGFPGTASHSMVYLSEVYGSRSAEEFEETLAHETSHLWWGVLVYPYDPTFWLVEGLAVLSQYDYTAAQHYAGLDRHRYLGSRYRWNELLVRYLTDPATLPPLVLGAGQDYPTSLEDSTTWAYFKSSATLDHLRLIVGEATFAEALADYRAACTLEPCTTESFRDALEASAGRDLGFFFDQWVYGTTYPRLVVTHQQALLAEGGGVILTLQLEQDTEARLPLLMLVETVDGERSEVLVELDGATGRFEVEASAEVRSARPSPRHDSIVWSRSAQIGDVDFSMQVDGRDLIRCARALGTEAVDSTPPTPSIRDVNLDFEPRCDFDEDADVDDADLAIITDGFGEGVWGSP